MNNDVHSLNPGKRTVQRIHLKPKITVALMPLITSVHVLQSLITLNHTYMSSSHCYLSSDGTGVI